MVAAVGGFLFGYDLAVISGAIIFLKKYFSLNPTQMGFAVSCAMLGCIAGPILGGTLSDRLGRKKTLMMTASLFAVGAVGTALCGGLWQFNAFRILGGIGVGLASVVSPMYIAEVAPARIRGGLVTLNQLAIVVGVIASYIVSYCLSLSGGPEIWRWMFASACVPVILLLIGLSFVPESPRWLAGKNRKKEALSILIKIDGQESAAAELDDIAASLTERSGTFLELFKPGIRTALLIAVCLAAFQQFTGASPLSFYTPVIFQNAGFTSASSALQQSLIVNVWNLICTVFTIWFIDRFGRRPLLLGGTALMAVGLVLMGLFFYLHLSGYYVMAMMLFISAAYGASLAPLAWLIMSEIFPTQLRGRAMAVASVVLWVSAYTGAQIVPPLISFFERVQGTGAGVFWLFACVCVVAFLFSWRMVPETKGRTLEEIGRRWKVK